MNIYENRSFSDKVWLVLKGLGMGTANKVPGVSGGVVAFVAGFYEEFIYSLQKINKNAFKLLIGGRFRSFYQYINGQFLVLLLTGMVISFFSISKLLDYLLEHYEIHVWSGFFGMIIGSAYYMAKDFGKWDKRYFLIMLSGLLIGVGISFFEPVKENNNLFFVFVCGIISVSGMTLPGLSGSFILMILGNYVLLLVDSVNALYDTLVNLVQWNLEPIRSPERVELLKVLSVFTAGSLAGLVSFSHLLAYVLKRYKKETYALIIGFITGSLGVVWPWKNPRYELDLEGKIRLDANQNEIITGYSRYFPDTINLELILALFFVVVGIMIVLGLGKYEEHKKKQHG